MKKRVFSFFLTTCMACTLLSSCAPNDPAETEVEEEVIDLSILYDAGFSEYKVEKYTEEFQSFYTPEEYLDLCYRAEEVSAYPLYAVNEFLLIAEQDLSTYDTENEQDVLMKKSGEIIGPCLWIEGDGWAVVGDFVFYAGGYISGGAGWDILDSQGNYVNNFTPTTYGRIQPLLDVGDGFYVFALYKGNDVDKLVYVYPSGNCLEILWPKQYQEPFSTLSDVEGGLFYVGKVSDGMIAVLSKRPVLGSWAKDCDEGYLAYYCDEQENIVIDLSTATTNYKVYELGDFSNGEASIKFYGVDGKRYSTTINKSGEFVVEPTPVID